jgi:hypothetical protein
MGQVGRTSSTVSSPEIREAVRSQIVGHGEVSSFAIAAALDLSHAVVVRTLERFEAVGCLRLAETRGPGDSVRVEMTSLSAQFRDLALSLW